MMGFKSKLLNLKDCAINSMIYDTYYNKDIDENLVYLESRDGLDFTGNIFRIVEELSGGNYGNLKIHVHAKPQVVDKIKALKKNYNLKIDKIITKEASATKTLEKAKYIFTDSGIRPKYVKREGQIFVNTWHGTPLKLMGADNTAEEHRIGNVQHPLLSSDYLLYPNDYMMEKMLKSYMIEKIYPGEILLEGYPRNSVFFDEKRKNELKSILGLEGKEIFVYMPTFRGILMDRNEEGQKDDVSNYLSQLDLKLSDNQVLFAKLHVLNESQIDFSKFKHVRAFPKSYEIYDVLNTADVLITDYSSVFFDFANTRRKIVLFNYDEEDYCSYRGFYFPLSELPFPKVQNIDDLVSELNSPKEYDDEEFLDRFCTYDKADAVKNICEQIFNGKKVCKTSRIENDNPNILFYGGALLNNGITSSLLNLLENLDREKYNIFISYNQWEDNILENHELIFKKFPDNIEFLPFRFNLIPTIKEKLAYNKYYLSEDKMQCPDELHNLFRRSFEKQYPNIEFSAVIDFDGYNKVESLIFANSNQNNAIFVHSDMIREMNSRGLQNLNILHEAYSTFRHVCVVSPALIEPTSQISGRKDNIKVVHNINDYEGIKIKSSKDILINDNTVVYNNDIFDVLNSSSKKFITIGRFSPEKGHERLLKAFDEYCNDFPDTQLIIIGGEGIIYDETVEMVDRLKHGQNVTLIKNISNPMPILRQCDLFILSSYYEGWPMVIMEADTLGVPIIATDIESTMAMGEYGGYIVDNSCEGILKGMHDFAEGKVRPLNSDYRKYNRNAIDEFLQIIK